MKSKISYIIFLVASIYLFGQVDKQTLPFDTLMIERKSFSEQKIQEYKQQEEFNYVEEVREPTVIEKVWDWIKRKVKSFLSYLFDDIKPVVGVLREILEVLPYIIVTIVLLLIIKMFLKISIRNVVDGKNNTSILNITNDEELIREKDLPKLIEQAILQKNYPLVVRYYYLLVLKEMSSKKMIIWQQEKTNEDYVKELQKNITVKPDFERLTNLYDFVWYGNFEIEEHDFYSAENDFKTLLNKIVNLG